MPPWLKLSIIRYESRVNGAIQGKEKHPPLHLGVVAIEMGTFELSSATVSQLMITSLGEGKLNSNLPKLLIKN